LFFGTFKTDIEIGFELEFVGGGSLHQFIRFLSDFDHLQDFLNKI